MAVKDKAEDPNSEIRVNYPSITVCFLKSINSSINFTIAELTLSSGHSPWELVTLVVLWAFNPANIFLTGLFVLIYLYFLVYIIGTHCTCMYYLLFADMCYVLPIQYIICIIYNVLFLFYNLVGYSYVFPEMKLYMSQLNS